MTDAKDVGVVEVVRHLDALTGYFSAVGMNSEEYLGPIRNARTALLALQAEIARITKDYATSLSLSSDTLARVVADRDRLREENARLAGEVASLTDSIIRIADAARANLPNISKIAI